MRLLPVTLCLLLLVPASAAEARSPGLRIHVLSNRADLLSAGDALVRIERRVKVRASRIRVTAGRRDVSRAFRVRRNGKVEGS